MIMMCPRADTHLAYMIDIVLTTEFTIPAGGGAMTGAGRGIRSSVATARVR
jgi:hypothetical protein